MYVYRFDCDGTSTKKQSNKWKYANSGSGGLLKAYVQIYIICMWMCVFNFFCLEDTSSWYVYTIYRIFLDMAFGISDHIST